MGAPPAPPVRSPMSYTLFELSFFTYVLAFSDYVVNLVSN